jgi:hypothetical protein
MFEKLTNEELVTSYAEVERSLVALREKHLLMEAELVQRMQADEATVIDHPTHTVKLKVGTEYDKSRLFPLHELVDPEVLAAGYTAEHEKTVTVPESYDMRKILPLRSRGKDVAAVIDAASHPGKPRLTIEAKEVK